MYYKISFTSDSGVPSLASTTSTHRTIKDNNVPGGNFCYFILPYIIGLVNNDLLLGEGGAADYDTL